MCVWESIWPIWSVPSVWSLWFFWFIWLIEFLAFVEFNGLLGFSSSLSLLCFLGSSGSFCLSRLFGLSSLFRWLSLFRYWGFRVCWVYWLLLTVYPDPKKETVKNELSLLWFSVSSWAFQNHLYGNLKSVSRLASRVFVPRVSTVLSMENNFGSGFTNDQ